MEEQLDILDEQGNPTGKTASRAIVHTTGLWHRVVLIYFYRKGPKGIEILVHLRAKTKDLHPNKWDTRFGGHVKAGDTLDDAVAKELKEEVGISVIHENLSEGHQGKHSAFPNNEFNTSYFYNFTEDERSLKFEDNEVQQVKWLPAEEILNDLTINPNNWATSAKTFSNILTHLRKL
jgi:isopentenyl-diphosphate delta-isomerase